MDKTLFQTPLGWLRITAFLEGSSFLLLLGVAMPLKYWADSPMMVRQVGMAHGVLFVAYVALAFLAYRQAKWSFSTLSLVMLASLLPFGTFVADAKIFKPSAQG